ncbi:MAG TPA: hypothetical protein VF077_13180 [Nitrospiraceae bacterium]
MNSQAIRRMLERMAEQHGGQRPLARWLNVSEAHLSEVLRGRREAGQTMAKALGLVREVSYKKARK